VKKVVVVGLPKTGTSSMTDAMHMLGFNLMHGRGGRNVLSGTKCDGLANTMEHEYESLYKEFPESAWFITKPSNVTRWLESLKFHLAYSKINFSPVCRGAHAIFGLPALRNWVTSTTGLSQPVDCDFGGGAYLKVYFEEYYRRVLAFFTDNNIPHTVVDVFGGLKWDLLAQGTGRCPLDENAVVPRRNTADHKESVSYCKGKNAMPRSKEWKLC
jgi:hypothetical protein